MKTKFIYCCVMALFLSSMTVSAETKIAISEIPSTGYTISESGTYFLTQDIKWKGEAGSLTAITITASDVVLDMQGHSLTAPRNVLLSGVIGIHADGADRLVLKNGTVKGFQTHGVALANSYGVSLTKINVSDIGNGVPGYTPYGLSASNCQNLTLKKISVKNINGSWFGTNSYGQIVSGIYLSDCINVNISGEISGINGYSSIVSGVFGMLCNVVTMNKLKINDVNGSAVAVSGASFGLSQNITISKSEVEDLHNDAGVCSGIATDDCQSIKVLNSRVKNLSTGLMPNAKAPGHTCIGMVFAPIRVIEGVTEINVTNAGELYSQILLPAVKIDAPAGSGTQAVGLPIVNSSGELEKVLILKSGSGYKAAPNVEIVSNPLWPLGKGATATAAISAIKEGDASDILVEKCKISDIKGSCDDAHGMSLFVVSDATVRNVIVQNVSDGRGGRGAKATGIEVYGLVNNQDSNILIEGCKVKNISATSPGDLQAAGFSVAGKGITFSKCKADNVRVNGVNPVDPTSPGYGIGFGWAPDIRPEYTYTALEVKIENCTAANSQVGFDTFYFQNSTWTNIKSIKNDVDVKEESTDVIRTLYCDQCSECPDAPQASPDNWYSEVPVQNIASGNTIDKSKIK